jgi:hypothetical protein
MESSIAVKRLCACYSHGLQSIAGLVVPPEIHKRFVLAEDLMLASHLAPEGNRTAEERFVDASSNPICSDAVVERPWIELT